MIEGSNSQGNPPGKLSDETMVNIPIPSFEGSAAAPEPISTAPGEVPLAPATIEAPTMSLGQDNPPTLINIPVPTEADMAAVPPAAEFNSAVTSTGK